MPQLFVLVLFVHEADFEEFAKGGQNLIRTLDAQIFDEYDNPTVVEVGRLHFDQCPTCKGTNREEKVNQGVMSSGSCRMCQGVKHVTE